jgi:hypothetical protein
MLTDHPARTRVENPFFDGKSQGSQKRRVATLLDLKRKPNPRSNQAYIQDHVGDDPGRGCPSRYR